MLGISSKAEEEDVVKAGKIEAWNSLEALEKAKARPYIAGTIVVLWAVSIVVGLAALVLTGNAVLLIGPPTVLTLTLYKVLKYYF